jgi:D-arabinose 1-dehydrogenase-like Zn-dependent alcohol dehydrogenase
MFKMFKVNEERSDTTSAASGSHPIIRCGLLASFRAYLSWQKKRERVAGTGRGGNGSLAVQTRSHERGCSVSAIAITAHTDRALDNTLCRQSFADET